MDYGPFTLSRDVSNPKLIEIMNTMGKQYVIKIAKTLRPSKEKWVPVGKQGLAALKGQINFGKDTLHVYDKTLAALATAKRFSALVDNIPTGQQGDSSRPASAAPHNNNVTLL